MHNLCAFGYNSRAFLARFERRTGASASLSLPPPAAAPPCAAATPPAAPAGPSTAIAVASDAAGAAGAAVVLPIGASLEAAASRSSFLTEALPRLLGVDVAMPHEVTGAHSTRQAVDPDLRALLEAHNVLDIRLYQGAQALFERRMASLPRDNR